MMKSKSFLFSSVVHLALLLAIFFHLQTHLSGEHALQTVDSYIYQSQKKRVHQQKSTVIKKNSLVVHEKLSLVQQQQKIFRLAQKENSLAKGVENELLKRLHQVIAEKQTYPQAAFALGQVGEVTVGFVLHENGELSGVHVVDSSGVASLDQAAVDSVKAINPFVEAQRYLHKDGVFAIKIEFA